MTATSTSWLQQWPPFNFASGSCHIDFIVKAKILGMKWNSLLFQLDNSMTKMANNEVEKFVILFYNLNAKIMKDLPDGCKLRCVFL